MNNKAMTLFEILVAVIILALVTAGLANVFVAGKRYIQHSRLRISGGELGKQFLDPLQNDVNASTWITTRLGIGGTSQLTDSIGGTVYTCTYDINTTNLPANLNRVKVSISWPENE
jgi:type II secretory pathway pseudopilin PulG